MTEETTGAIPIDRKAKDRRLQDRVLALMEQSGMSQGDLAAETGLSRSVISTWLSGRYDHDGDVVPSIEAWIVRAQGGVEQLRFVEIKNSRRVFDACQYAMEQSRIVLVVGKPGLGKTVALQEFQRRSFAAKKEILSYHVAPLIRPGSLARVLARRFEVNENRTAHDIIEGVIERLKRRHAMLIFDEANRFNVPCLEVIRYIHDSMRVPVVLCGSMDLLRTLLDTSGRYLELEQLQSRIALKVQLQPMTLKEVGEYLSHHFDPPCSVEVVRAFHEKSRGVIRDLANAVDNVKRIMRINKLPSPTPEAVAKAFEHQLLS